MGGNKSRLGSDVEKLYPYSAMLDQFRKFGEFGLYMASLFLPMSTDDDTPDLDAFSEDIHNGNDMNNNSFKIKGSERLEITLGGVFYDMDRLGYSKNC